MWEGVELPNLWWFAAVAVAVAGAIGLLGKARWRTVAIIVWSLAPAVLIAIAELALWLAGGERATGWERASFPLLLALFTVPPWAMVALLSFCLVGHFRRSRHGLIEGDH